MLKGGFLLVGSWRGAPVRLHLLTVPVALLAGLGRPLWWVSALTMAFLVLVHELGHAALVRRFRARVLAIDLLPFGGECLWAGEVSALHRALISWGGVLAQAVVLVAAGAAQLSGHQATSLAEVSALHTLTWSNLWMIVFNLLPIPPLDGSRCWAAVPLWWRSRARDKALARQRALADELHRLRVLEGEAIPEEIKAQVHKALDDARRANREGGDG